MSGRRTSGSSKPSLGVQVLAGFSFNFLFAIRKSQFKKCLCGCGYLSKTWRSSCLELVAADALQANAVEWRDSTIQAHFCAPRRGLLENRLCCCSFDLRVANQPACYRSHSSHSGPSGLKCPGSSRENGGCGGSVPRGVSRGPSGPSGSVQQVPESVPGVSTRSPGDSGDTLGTRFWTLASPGPKGPGDTPWDTPSNTPRFRRHSRGNFPATLGFANLEMPKPQIETALLVQIALRSRNEVCNVQISQATIYTSGVHIVANQLEGQVWERGRGIRQRGRYGWNREVGWHVQCLRLEIAERQRNPNQNRLLNLSLSTQIP